MDAEVLLETKDPKRPDISYVAFHIDLVERSIENPAIIFTDWRDI